MFRLSQYVSDPNGPPKVSELTYPDKGFCLRGVSCPYEHSEDVIIPSAEMMFPQNFPFPQPPFQRGGMRGRGGQRGGRPPPGASLPFVPPFPFPPFPFAAPNQTPNHTFFGSNRPPDDRNGSTLVVTNIPPQYLNTPSVTSYFSTFGEVTSVALDKNEARALVSFETNREAFKAWKSDDPVWGSRNVRVMWHRPRPGQGGLGLQVLEKNKAMVEQIKKDGTPEAAKERLHAHLRELEEKEKRGKRETLMAEQKVLLKRAKDGTQEEKKTLLARLRELGKEMVELDKPVEIGVGEDVEMDGKSKLDVELEKHGMETKESGEQKELMRLSEQLSALRDKVCDFHNKYNL
jgi:RNA-binding protein 26